MKFFDSMLSPEADDYTEEIAVSGSGGEGITFLVSQDGRVFYTCEKIPHRELLSKTVCSAKDIAWGGILTEQGDWVRPSGDFGDAPNAEIRQTVVSQIQEAIAT